MNKAEERSLHSMATEPTPERTASTSVPLEASRSAKNANKAKRQGKRKKAQRKKLIRIKFGQNKRYYDVSKKRPVAADEQYYSRRCGEEYRYGSDKQKAKLRRKYRKKNRLAGTVKIPEPEAEIMTGHLSEPEPGTLAHPLKAVLNLFPQVSIGCCLASDILIGLRANKLHQAGEGIPMFVTEINAASPELIHLLKKQLNPFQPVKWHSKRWTLRQKTVLDYRKQKLNRPYSLQQFSEVKIRWKNCKTIRFPASYSNTMVTVIGADHAQAREALPYMAEAAVLFVNSKVPQELKSTRLNPADMNSISASALETIKASKEIFRYVLTLWWAEGRRKWASALMKRARDRLKLPTDSDYISLSPEPRKFRDAIRCEVLHSFVEGAVANGYLDTAAAAEFRETIDQAFYPTPQPEKTKVRIEEPESFIPLMRKIVHNNFESIVPEGNRFVKSEKKLGAIRSISGEKCLVMPEKTWSAAYKRAAKAEEMDCSFCESRGWERNLQRILAEHQQIKGSGSNPRYRYDLYENDTRDSTYVVAVPWDSICPVE